MGGGLPRAEPPEAFGSGTSLQPSKTVPELGSLRAARGRGGTQGCRGACAGDQEHLG